MPPKLHLPLYPFLKWNYFSNETESKIVIFFNIVKQKNKIFTNSLNSMIITNRTEQNRMILPFWIKVYKKYADNKSVRYVIK